MKCNACNIDTLPEDTICRICDNQLRPEPALSGEESSLDALGRCRECDGSGVEDTGGVTPWDAPILTGCRACGGTGREPASEDGTAPTKEIAKE